MKKKVLLILITTIVMISLTGCDSIKNKDKKNLKDDIKTVIKKKKKKITSNDIKNEKVIKENENSRLDLLPKPVNNIKESIIKEQVITETKKVNNNNNPVIPIRKGYSFLGWYNESGKTIEYNIDYTYDYDMKMYVKWRKNKYNIEFITGDENINYDNKKIYYGVSIDELPEPEREGYLFQGWYTEENEKIENDMVYKYEIDIKLYAKWKPIISKINFVDDFDHELPTIEVGYEEKYSNLPELTQIGMTFEGWSLDNVEWNKIVTNDEVNKIVGDYTLYAKWSITEYNIEFITGDENINYDNKKIYYGISIDELPEPEREGYLFQGWYTEENEKIENDMVYKYETDIKLYAKWMKKFLNPVEGGIVTATFGYRYGNLHNGTDIGKGFGTPIKAVTSGRVYEVFSSCPPNGNNSRYCNSGYGNLIIIEHNVNGQIMYSTYQHLGTINVTKGQTVQTGSVIATMGSSGNVTSSCLHLGISVGNINNYIDPSKIIDFNHPTQ